MSNSLKSDWTIEELQSLYALPLIRLISRAHHVHAAHHPVDQIQTCSLLSIKTGGCPEDCRYCAQSARYKTDVSPTALMPYETVMAEARRAQARGATRFCLGAAWREVRDGRAFDEILRMVKGVAAMGLEVCCTLGMLKEHQARALKEAGLHSYSHNLDTSEAYYPSIITTRTYRDRLDTLDTLERTGIKVCCGGILGLGEAPADRIAFIHALCTRTPHPCSVPINRLTPICGTPLEKAEPVSIWEMCRVIAVARITMPKAMVRLSSGRQEMTFVEQALCFFAGANSIHMGAKLLTVSNHPIDKDDELFQLLGLSVKPGVDVDAHASCQT